MFSGIVEAVVPALRGEALSGVYRLVLARPLEFTDLKGGDSIAVDGACLTIEDFDEHSMTFAVAAESLKVLEWNPHQILQQKFNLERSLRFGDRLHGHLVSGHVEGRGTVVRRDMDGESLFMDIRIPPSLRSYVWKKGSLAIHGVSLTVNDVQDDVVSVCLIPETLKRTNLFSLQVGERVNLESDFMARAVIRALETGVVIPTSREESPS